MGFNLYTHRFRHGQHAPYPRRIAEQIFDRGALQPCGFDVVEYPDGRGEIYCSSDEDAINGFMLAHFGGRTISERVLEIADETGSLIYWPSPNIWMGVTDRSTIEHLPEEAKAERQAIALVRTFEELWAAIDA